MKSRLYRQHTHSVLHQSQTNYNTPLQYPIAAAAGIFNLPFSLESAVVSRKLLQSNTTLAAQSFIHLQRSHMISLKATHILNDLLFPLKMASFHKPSLFCDILVDVVYSNSWSSSHCCHVINSLLLSLFRVVSRSLLLHLVKKSLLQF